MRVILSKGIQEMHAKGSKMRNTRVFECPECGANWEGKFYRHRSDCGWTRKVICHASKKEYRRWCELKALEKAGQIRGLERQKRFQFELLHGFIKTPRDRDLTYTADFVYEERRPIKGTVGYQYWQVVEDVKGRKKGAAYDLYHLKSELMRLCHGIEVKEV